MYTLYNSLSLLLFLSLAHIYVCVYVCVCVCVCMLCLAAKSCLTLCDPIDCSPLGSFVHGILQVENTGVGCHALLQGIFPTQGSNSGLPCYRQILYQLSHQGSPEILEWVAYPFSKVSSRPRNRTGVSHIPGSFFTSWATREAPLSVYMTS